MIMQQQQVQHQQMQQMQQQYIQQQQMQQQQKSSNEGVCNRISRSASRSKNIMDRARSFERGGAENSRPGSRAGSVRSSSGHRTAKQQNVEEAWVEKLERPGSRTDVDSRHFHEIGKVSTANWEERIKRGSMETLPTRTPPPRRKEMKP